MNGLQILDVHKTYAGHAAAAGVSFTVSPGEVVAVLGPSGCGKSTLLRLIAGLELPDQGDITWDGVSMAHTPVHQRDFGLMFQEYALFPHRSVGENVAFGLQMRGMPDSQVRQEVESALERVHLPGFSGRGIHTLSGGEQQRVALARSLAPHPRLLMLDEPLGSLDRALRESLVMELHQVLRSAGQTAIYVTHDQEEAFTLADRVVVMNQGRVEQIGTPHDVFLRPETEFVARFLGLNNLLPVELIQSEAGLVARTPIGEFPYHGERGSRMLALLRPDAVRLGKDGPCSLSGLLRQVTFRGSRTRIMIEIEDRVLEFEIPTRSALPTPGEGVCLSFDPVETIQYLYR
jgi:ABC-type Fe3+/spermidine/putrescine transport system ATPase subunit